MKGRLGCIREYVNGIFDRIEDAETRRAAYIHSYGVSQCCAILALKRGLDLELAAAIGLLHDVYSYKTGITSLHCHNGAEMVRVALKRSLADLFTVDEQTTIKSAIYHHSDKGHVHDEYDELLKDSDVLQHLSLDTTYGWIQSQRLLHVINELALPEPSITVLPKEIPTVTHFSRSRLADIAGALAKRAIVGDRSDSDFVRIIRYFPEDTAAQEFRSGWCAAFVYHCCLEAGLLLPIRASHSAAGGSGRFGGVSAWHEWGTGEGFCHAETVGFAPERGDIVIYDNIIPAGNKAANGGRYDHMGIVLSSESNGLIVAEGNVDNLNISGVVSRKRDNTVGYYIRIREDYLYEGWKTDFKTGEVRLKKAVIGDEGEGDARAG